MTKEEAPQVRLNTRVVVGVQLFTLALLFLLAGSSGQLREIACSRKLGPQQEQGALFPSLDFCQHPAWGAVKAQLTTLPALPAPAPSQQQPQPQQEPQQEQQQQRLEREEVTPSQEDGTLAMCLAAKGEHTRRARRPAGPPSPTLPPLQPPVRRRALRHPGVGPAPRLPGDLQVLHLRHRV